MTCQSRTAWENGRDERIFSRGELIATGQILLIEHSPKLHLLRGGGRREAEWKTIKERTWWEATQPLLSDLHLETNTEFFLNLTRLKEKLCTTPLRTPRETLTAQPEEKWNLGNKR